MTDFRAAGHLSTHAERTPRVVFLFSGATNRNRILEEVQRGENADTVFRGMNHIAGTEYIEIRSFAHGLRLIPRLLRFDAVVTSDDFALGWVTTILARCFRRPTKWIYVAIHSSTLMRRHATHPVRLALLKLFWRSCARIVCFSNGQLEDFVRAGMLHERLIFVPFGIDADFYASIDASKDQGLVVSVGRDLGRDYPTLLTAAQKSEHPFVIVAAGKNVPQDTLLPPNVTVRYNIPLAEIRKLYAQARLVVVPSKEEGVLEGSDCSGQTAILDAMAAGRPVIATERSWIKDYFTESKEIITTPPNNPEALAEAIERVWTEPGQATQMAAAARTRVQQRYTTKAFASTLLSIINEL